MSPSTNLNWKTIAIALSVVLGIALVYYIVNLIAGSTIAWFAVLLVFVNLYLIYRVRIRKSLGKKLFGQGDFTNSSKRPSQKVEASDKPDIETQKDAYEEIQQEYRDCPECGSQVIPELQYCEDCGHQF